MALGMGSGFPDGFLGPGLRGHCLYGLYQPQVDLDFPVAHAPGRLSYPTVEPINCTSDLKWSRAPFPKSWKRCGKAWRGSWSSRPIPFKNGKKKIWPVISLKYQDQNIALARVTSTLFPLSIFLTSLSLAVVLWIGGKQVIDREITAGDFVAFISYLGLLSWPVSALGWGINLIKRGAVSLERIERILKERPEIADLPGLTAPTVLAARSASERADLFLFRKKNRS